MCSGELIPVHNVTQCVNAADTRMEPKFIPTYTGTFYPPFSMHCIVL